MALDLVEPDGVSEERLGVDVSPVSGQEVLAALRQIGSAPPTLLEYLRKLFAESKT